MASTDKQSNRNQEPNEWDAGREERERRGNEALEYQWYLKQQIAASQQRQAEMSNAKQLRADQKASRDKEWQDTGGGGETGENGEEKVAAPARAGTSRALQWAWRSLFTVIGFIPGLIWINIHVLLKMIFGEKLFCKLGDEWIPKQVSAAGGEAGKMASRSIGIVEVMGLVFLDLMALLLILIALAVIFMLIDLTTGWFGWIVDLVT